jgi:hypothetical protein
LRIWPGVSRLMREPGDPGRLASPRVGAHTIRNPAAIIQGVSMNSERLRHCGKAAKTMNLCPFVRRARERHAVGNVVGAPEDPNDLAWTMTVASASRRRGQFELPARTEGTTKRLSICCLCRHELFSPTFSPTRLIQTDPASSLRDDLAQPCACCTSIDASGRVAMQEVVGSSPIIRSSKALQAGNCVILFVNGKSCVQGTRVCR